MALSEGERNVLEEYADRQTVHLPLIVESVPLTYALESTSPYAGLGILGCRDHAGAGQTGGKLQFDSREWILFD